MENWNQVTFHLLQDLISGDGPNLQKRNPVWEMSKFISGWIPIMPEMQRAIWSQVLWPLDALEEQERCNPSEEILRWTLLLSNFLWSISTQTKMTLDSKSTTRASLVLLKRDHNAGSLQLGCPMPHKMNLFNPIFRHRISLIFIDFHNGGLRSGNSVEKAALSLPTGVAPSGQH